MRPARATHTEAAAIASPIQPAAGPMSRVQLRNSAPANGATVRTAPGMSDRALMPWLAVIASHPLMVKIGR